MTRFQGDQEGQLGLEGEAKRELQQRQNTEQEGVSKKQVTLHEKRKDEE